MNQNFCNKILIRTIKNTVHIITSPHIVGVHDFLLCSFENMVAFPIDASSLIFFHSFKSTSISIKAGVRRNPTRNVSSQKENIDIKCSFKIKKLLEIRNSFYHYVFIIA